MFENKSTLSKKQKKQKTKRKAFFSSIAAKRPGVNAASVLDDHLLGWVYYLNWLGLCTSKRKECGCGLTRVRSKCFWSRVMIWGILRERIIAWLWGAQCGDRIDLLPGQEGLWGLCFCGLKKKRKKRGFWFQGPYVDPDADPLGVMIHLPSVEVSYGKTDSALASSSGWCTV